MNNGYPDYHQQCGRLSVEDRQMIQHEITRLEKELRL